VEGVDATKEEDETRTSLDEPVEELRERIENLSIDEDGFDRQRRDGGGATDTVHAEDEREERGDAEEEKETMETMTTTMMMMGCGSSEGIEMIIAPPGDEGGTESERRLVPSSSSSSSSSLPSNERMIERTRVFYDVHSPEYARDVLDVHYEALCPAVHRDAFLSHVRRQRRSANGGAKDALHDDDDDHRPATTTIIDVGCGCGRDARHFASMGHNVLGIDFSMEMLKRAREDASGAHFLRMDVRDLRRSLVDESVDGAWAHLSLMHLQRCDALDVLGGLRSAARVGGVLFVSLEMGNDDDDYDGSLVFEIDERYAASENVPPFHPGLVASDENEVATGLAAVDADDDDTRRKLCSYYTMTQARELLTDSGWDVIDMGEDDRREMSEYVTHSMLYAFATRRK
jgi:SAM-dependent methyltransferase